MNIRIWRGDPTRSALRAAAQTYPDRVVQIIAPATAGSRADILGRVLAPSTNGVPTIRIPGRASVCLVLR